MINNDIAVLFNGICVIIKGRLDRIVVKVKNNGFESLAVFAVGHKNDIVIDRILVKHLFSNGSIGLVGTIVIGDDDGRHLVSLVQHNSAGTLLNALILLGRFGIIVNVEIVFLQQSDKCCEYVEKKERQWTKTQYMHP